MASVYRTSSSPKILDEVSNAGYVVFEKGDFNLNIIITRILPGRPNRFDDIFNLVYQESGQWVQWTASCTADPGISNIKTSPKGLASVVPGQYRGVWRLGFHGLSRKNYPAYEALVQSGNKISVWRDRNRDGTPDRNGPIDTGFFGINYHRATKKGTSIIVDDWSEGCIVNPSSTDFDESIQICKHSANIFGNRFSFVLLEKNWGGK